MAKLEFKNFNKWSSILKIYSPESLALEKLLGKYLIIRVLNLPLYGLGIVIIFFGIVKKIKARHLKAKYKN